MRISPSNSFRATSRAALLIVATAAVGCGRSPKAQPAANAESPGADVPAVAQPAQSTDAERSGHSGADSPPAAHPDQIVVTADATPFKPCPPALPKPCEMVVMEGDPKGTGIFATRFRIPKGFEMPPHYHPRAERVTIISGKVGVGFGDEPNHEKGKVFGPGDFYVNAPNAHHYVWVEEDAVLQINGIGPWQAIPVGEKDPPALPASEISEPPFPEGQSQIVVSASDTKFGPCPPTLPKGCEMAVMEGDPKQAKFFSVRFRAGVEFAMPPHHHPAPERVTIISGRVGVGFGDVVDREKGRVFGAGDFYVNPASAIHFVWTEEPTVLQINGVGPWKAIPVEKP